ncbi:MAG TPA: glycosyltransferase [Pirellulales bacterium]|nr:glycosyltransferase [Pirellulales bacterium]
MSHFFLADPSLISVSGHCWSYLRSLIAPAQRLGYQTVLLGNRAVDPELRAAHDIKPLFQCSCDVRFGVHDETFVVHNRALRDDLDMATRWYNIGRRDVVFLNTLRHWALIGMVDWLESLPPERRPCVVLVMHFTAHPNPHLRSETLPYYKAGFDRIDRSPARDRIFLMADSQELVDEYRTINDRLSWVVAPIPHGFPAAPVARGAGARLRLGSLGEARENKGFHLLPYLVRRVMASPEGRDVEFHLHVCFHDQKSPYYRQVRARLARLPVTMYPDKLDEEQYARLLGQMDVVLLPYTLENYHAHTSGILSEAMAMGKLLVVPKGTWMARQVTTFGSGVTFNPEDVDDLSRQVLHLISHHARFAAGAESRARHWREFHNPERLVRLVVEFIERQAHCATRKIAA